MDEHQTGRFSIDQSEIVRRISAFTALIISLYLGMLTASLLMFFRLVTEHAGFVLLFSLVVLSVFFGFRAIIVIFFKQFLKTNIYLTDTSLVRNSLKSTDTFLLDNMTKLVIKRTTRKKIREISIRFTDGKSLSVDGLENFEVFMDMLISRARDATVIDMPELFDYDNPVFYPVLGLLAGSTAIGFIKPVSALLYSHIEIVYLVFAVYVTNLGVYFVACTPLTKRYGRKLRNADYVFGLSMLTASLAIILMSFKAL